MSTIPNGPGGTMEGAGGLPGGEVIGNERGGTSSRSTTEKVAEKAHRTIDGAAARAEDAERDLRRAAGEAATRVRMSEEQISAALDQNVEKVKSYIEKNPIASAGIAFVAGLVLSTFLRR